MTWRRPPRGPDPSRFRTVPYDLLKEVTIALGITGVLVIGLAAVLSSPDVPPDTIQRWSRADPVDFVSTAASELAGSSVSAQYGPPYNQGSGSVQSVGPLSPQQWAGVHEPVDAANQFVLQPLREAASTNPRLTAALADFDAATAAQQAAWLDAYRKALPQARDLNGRVAVPSGQYGPVTDMMDSLLEVARSGGLDGLLLSGSGTFYQTDYTDPLLFMGDGGHLSGLAQDQHLTGSQWGVMNETGRYPGQAWLWLYTMWYQIPPYSGSPNADLLVVLTMGALTLALLLVPFIPGLRDLPRWVPIHRLIWRRFHAAQQARRSS
ncbi:MAG: hypothetical protein ACYDAC_11950 [Candidatus Dormibacteria bacterium]